MYEAKTEINYVYKSGIDSRTSKNLYSANSLDKRANERA